MRRFAPLFLAVFVAVAAFPARALAQEGEAGETGDEPVEDEVVVHEIVFPVVGDVRYSDTFGAPRGPDRTHEGQDLMGEKMQPLVAAADGELLIVTWPQPTYGYYIKLRGDDGWTYSYVHINNDTPGTDDGQATREDVYAEGIEEGVRVERGQLLGYLGDSGNAERTAPHLHFEMHDPDGHVVNPYASLQAAQRVDSPIVASAEPSPIPRLAGLDRVATAVAVSERGWPDGAERVVLAAGDTYAEALPASVLAASAGAPLLLETGDELTDVVADELDRLGAEEVAVIGSVAAGVEDDLRGAGLDVRRIGTPADPVGTAAAMASEVGGASGVAVLVNRTRFADGVSAAALAAAHGWPILLADTALVPQTTVDTWRALGVRRLVLVGGTAALGANIESFARARGRCATEPGCEVQRVAGADRYATSVAAAEASVELGSSVESVLLGTGTNYPDTLASGPLAAHLGGIALLVDGSGGGADDASRAFLAAVADDVDDVAILGGSGAVTTAADRAIQHALGLR